MMKLLRFTDTGTILAASSCGAMVEVELQPTGAEGNLWPTFVRHICQSSRKCLDACKWHDSYGVATAACPGGPMGEWLVLHSHFLDVVFPESPERVEKERARVVVAQVKRKGCRTLSTLFGSRGRRGTRVMAFPRWHTVAVALVEGFGVVVVRVNQWRGDPDSHPSSLEVFQFTMSHMRAAWMQSVARAGSKGKKEM